jgi:hypothetical protein
LPIKKVLRDLLERSHFEQIAEIASRKKRALGSLVSLTFEAQEQIAWRAVEAMGLAASRIAEEDPEFVRNHLRRLYWLLSEESGGVCWRAPESMAEIVRRRPKLFADYVPIVVSLITSMAEEDLEGFRASILWAIGRLAPVADDHLQSVLPAILSALDDSDPQVRGMAVWCLTQLRQEELLAGRPDLVGDEGPVDLYEDGHLNRTSVCDLMQRATRG